MNHRDLVRTISDNTGIHKTDADMALRGLADVIAAELHIHGSITLHEIGTISVVETAARKGRNPQTGAEIDIPAGKRIKLKAAKALKDAVAA
ncbi:HU family DNA-binding protein [Methylomonas sp. ZR1]|uniref:HU family DNA-binding protein n=1 Tax=Methylomonas sp. ZR1 TaxID=1797072 RepID=UPI0014912426|nr:HU family DNA-binding protein [Methylomonas sp. ZR1]NOV29191.1 HU family DNA-binding protein [Methylomonas sp. ZR1]